MNTPKRLITLVLSLTGLLLLSACTSPYLVRVDALAADRSHSNAGTRYVWKSDLEGMSESDLFFREVADSLNLAMRQRGFVEANAGEAADIEVYVKAYLSKPLTESLTRSDPIYAERGGYSRVISVPVVNSAGQVVNYVHRTVYSPPRTEMVGIVNRSEQITVYEKVLRLSARLPSDEGERGLEVWNLSVALRNRSTDYRSFLPYLLTAATPYIGTRTEGEVIIEIPPNDPSVERFKGPAAP